MTLHAPRLPFSLDPLMAEARRRMRQRRFLIAASVVILGGGAAGASLALRSTSNASPVACPAAEAYAYQLPGGGWLPTRQPFNVGERIRSGTLRYRVAAITALPHQCQPIVILGWNGPAQVEAGRLSLQPVK